MSALNLLRAVVLIGLLLPFAHLSARAATLPGQGRVTSTAIICAFEPERAALVKRIKGAATRHLDGMEFVTGRLGSQPVVLMTSGVSMVAGLSCECPLPRHSPKNASFVARTV